MVITAFSLVLILQGGQVVERGGPPPAPVPKDAPAALPDTPQGKLVRQYVDAFNRRDEAAFLEAQEALMSPETLARRPAADRAKMYKRMRGDFDTLKIKRAVATSQQIRAVIPDRDGNEAIFTFDFDAKPPYKITGIGVDIGRMER
jgi:hypothetical protein